ELAAELARRSREHASTLMAEQTYLQHAQPATFGHYLLSFAFPVLRAGQRRSEALAWTDASPGGAGCVNGSRLLSDRAYVASLLGFRTVAEHTRDAMWQVDGLFDMVGAAAGLLVTQSKLAEDLEIWASQEFDYVTLADGYSRASVLMPQKRDPYAPSIIRRAAGSLPGRAARRRHRRGHARRGGRRGHRPPARPGRPRPVRGPRPVADRGQPDRARRRRARRGAADGGRSRRGGEPARGGGPALAGHLPRR